MKINKFWNGNLWKLILRDFYVRSKNAEAAEDMLAKTSICQFHQAENGQGLVPWGLSNAGAPRFTNRHSADFIETWKWWKKHERGMTLSILELCSWLCFYKMFIPNLWNMSFSPGYLHDMLICIHICPQFHTYIYIHRVFHANAYIYIYIFFLNVCMIAAERCA